MAGLRQSCAACGPPSPTQQPRSAPSHLAPPWCVQSAHACRICMFTLLPSDVWKAGCSHQRLWLSHGACIAAQLAVPAHSSTAWCCCEAQQAGPGIQNDRTAVRHPQVGNQAFAFAFQQLLDLSYLWSTSTHLNVTNATLASGAVPADEVRVLNDTRTVVSGRNPCRVLAVCGMSFHQARSESCLRFCSPSRCEVPWHGSRGAGRGAATPATYRVAPEPW